MVVNLKGVSQMRKLPTNVWFWFIIFCLALGVVFYIVLASIFSWANATVSASLSVEDYTASSLTVEQNFGTQNNNGYLIQPTDNPQKEAGQL